MTFLISNDLTNFVICPRKCCFDEPFAAYLGCEILMKGEYANAGGSVKDRAALYLLKDAIETGV